MQYLFIYYSAHLLYSYLQAKQSMSCLDFHRVAITPLLSWKAADQNLAPCSIRVGWKWNFQRVPNGQTICLQADYLSQSDIHLFQRMTCWLWLTLLHPFMQTCHPTHSSLAAVCWADYSHVLVATCACPYGAASSSLQTSYLIWVESSLSTNVLLVAFIFMSFTN